MRQWKLTYLLAMLLVTALIAAGCSSDGPVVLQDEQGQDVSLENMDQPALVFLFTGVG